MASEGVAGVVLEAWEGSSAEHRLEPVVRLAVWAALVVRDCLTGQICCSVAAVVVGCTSDSSVWVGYRLFEPEGRNFLGLKILLSLCKLKLFDLRLDVVEKGLRLRFLRICLLSG